MSDKQLVQQGTIEALLKQAAERFAAMPPEEQAAMIRAQRRSYVLAEAYLGADADEAAFRAALADGDSAEVQRLSDEARARRDRAAAIYDRIGL